MDPIQQLLVEAWWQRVALMAIALFNLAGIISMLGLLYTWCSCGKRREKSK